MGTSGEPYDGRLELWEDVQDRHPWDVLVLGNGLSINIWGNFDYESLFQEAKARRFLSATDTALCDQLGSTNLERVLHSLSEAIRVGDALGQPRHEERARHATVREALAKAVQSVHVRGGEIPTETFTAIADEIGAFRHVFTTSYDLLLYWSVAEAGFKGYPDYFWAGARKDEFQESTIWLDLAAPCTRLYFLHGALHLVVLQNGATCKRRSNEFHSLLDQFGTPYAGDTEARPLIVTEARATDKREAIAENDYLRYCWRQLRECDKPLVIFGHSLSDQDSHLVDAINEHPERAIAFAMRDRNKKENRREQHRVCSRLDSPNIAFFDRESHPLGSKSLTLKENLFRTLWKSRQAA